MRNLIRRKQKDKEATAATVNSASVSNQSSMSIDEALRAQSILVIAQDARTLEEKKKAREEAVRFWSKMTWAQHDQKRVEYLLNQIEKRNDDLDHLLGRLSPITTAETHELSAPTGNDRTELWPGMELTGFLLRTLHEQLLKYNISASQAPPESFNLELAHDFTSAREQFAYSEPDLRRSSLVFNVQRQVAHALTGNHHGIL